MSHANDRQTVLIADDNKALLDLAVQVLRWSGKNFSILAAPDGAAALDLAKKHPGSIDLLVSDVDMPRMRGPELARALRAQNPNIRILLISGLGEVQLEPGWLFLSKPFTPNQLMEQIDKLLGRV